MPTPEELERLAAELPEPPAEVVEALRRDLDASRDAAQAPSWPPFLQAARDKVDVRYAGPPTSERPLVGQALVLAKRIFRLFGQPFINEALRKQVEFNQEILAAAVQLHEQLQQQARSHALWRAEMERRLGELERRLG